MNLGRAIHFYPSAGRFHRVARLDAHRHSHLSIGRTHIVDFGSLFDVRVRASSDGCATNPSALGYQLEAGVPPASSLPFVTADSFVERAGPMSYGMDVPALGHRVADIADHVLKGQKPSDIPVVQPSKFELIINLETAKALGLTVPPELLALTDEVIE